MIATASTPSPPGDLWPQARSLLLLGNGRAVVLARNAAPLPEVIHDSAARLAGLGLAGWLVAAEFRRPGHRPRLRRLRRVIEGNGTWEAAVRSFIAAWMARTTVHPAPLRKPLKSEPETATGRGHDVGSALPARSPTR